MKTQNPTHTHEVRHHDYRKGAHHNDVLKKGTHEECFTFLQKEADKDKVGVGLLVNNGGYSLVDLEQERITNIKLAGVDLYEALKESQKLLQRIVNGEKPTTLNEQITLNILAITKAEQR